MIFNENSRVKIPSLLHLTRLGYQYLSLKNQSWDETTNIFTDIFKESISKINPNMEDDDIKRLLVEIKLSLDNEDLGKVFYGGIISQSGTKIIDFVDFSNNNFHVVTELTYKNGDEEFRPDITILINGLPLAFIEVKKPNNQEGIQAEFKRINTRFQNKKFTRFANITQLMVFSNNQPYNNDSSLPLQGVFYASPSYHKHIFNCFKEEESFDLSLLLAKENEHIENEILKDNNLLVIKSHPEFITNKNPDTPTNSFLTSLFSQSRLQFILNYAIAYVKDQNGWQKHIMRYPQILATKAIEKKLNEGLKNGIIWHTQGSGKTALAFYNVRFLTDYFQQKKIIPKFYFIVDRIDLLEQAKREFSSRGLKVHIIASKNDFAKEIKSNNAINNYSGNPEITVVNIQKFKDDPNVVKITDYDVNIQRIYFLDEVHRSYNPKGSFLANLNESDRNAIQIGLTGTPLLGEDYNSKMLFGGYIHKYYYNSSIADGYTLRLIREEIATNYKLILQEVLNNIQVKQGDIEKKLIYSHRQYVEPLLDYIIDDFEFSRIRFDDNSIGAMVICDSSDQAKQLYEVFQEKFNLLDRHQSPSKKIDPPLTPLKKGESEENRVKSAALILHDVDSKEERKNNIEAFKEGKIDILFVYNMLLTGFDAKRLKKLYLGRVIKRHNLLQALTRVNRPYKNFRYGFVVDFADIRSEFDATNKAYFDELQAELGDELTHYSKLFKSSEEINTEIEEIKDILFRYDSQNAEIFCQQISNINDRQEILTLKKALENANNLYNLIRLTGQYELLKKLDFSQLKKMEQVTGDRLNMINLEEKLAKGIDTNNLLNEALEDVIFSFVKVGEEELILADQLKDTLRRTREAFVSNIDANDPNYISLKEELERLFKQKKLSEVTQEEMNKNIDKLNELHKKINAINHQNNLLKAKYDNDFKYVRIHKRIMESGKLAENERKIYDALSGVKINADNLMLQNSKIINNESYFSQTMTRLLIEQFSKKQQIKLNGEMSSYINKLIIKEYDNEFNTGD